MNKEAFQSNGKCPLSDRLRFTVNKFEHTGGGGMQDWALYRGGGAGAGSLYRMGSRGGD